MPTARLTWGIPMWVRAGSSTTVRQPIAAPTRLVTPATAPPMVPAGPTTRGPVRPTIRGTVGAAGRTTTRVGAPLAVTTTTTFGKHLSPPGAPIRGARSIAPTTTQRVFQWRTAGPV